MSSIVKESEVSSESEVEVSAEVEVDPIVKQLSSLTENLEALAKLSKSLSAEMKTLTRDVNKLRTVKGGKGVKRVKKPVDPDSPRKLGALERPVSISDELCSFLGLTVGEDVSRQVVTQKINKYVKDNDLQNPENRRYILLDSEAGKKLKVLLRDPDQPLTFFNIQRYLKPHYPVSAATLAAAAKALGVSGDVKPDSKGPATTVVVADEGKVDETPSTESDAKKKVVRRVVKKVA